MHHDFNSNIIIKHYVFKFDKKCFILNCNAISKYYCFYKFSKQKVPFLVKIRHLFKKQTFKKRASSNIEALFKISSSLFHRKKKLYRVGFTNR